MAKDALASIDLAKLERMGAKHAVGRVLGEVGQTPSKLARRAIDDALRGVVGLNPVDDVTTSRASPCPFASDPPSTDPTRHPIGGVTWV